MQYQNNKFELAPPAGDYNSENDTEDYMKTLEYVRAEIDNTYGGYFAIIIIAFCYFPVLFGFLFLAHSLDKLLQ